MKSNLLNKFCLLSALAISSTFLLSNANLDAHIDQVGPAPETIIREIVCLDGSEEEFPGSIIVGLRRDIYVGFPVLKEVRHYTEEGDLLETYRLPIGDHDTIEGMALSWNGHVYIAVSSNHSDANGVWKITKKGKISKFADLPRNSCPANLVFDKSNHLYVTDCLGGKIFKIAPKGCVETWFCHRFLKGCWSNPVVSGFPQGANGITTGKKSKCLYVGHTDFGQIIRITIKQDGSAGKVSIFAEDRSLVGVEGISLNRRGILYAANPFQDTILAVHSKGNVEEVIGGSPLDAPSDIAMKKRKKGINLGFFTNSAENYSYYPGIYRIKVAVDPEHQD